MTASTKILLAAAMAAAALTPAEAAPECATKAEARAAHPREIIYWHGASHCWDATPPSRYRHRHRVENKRTAEVAAADPARTAAPTPAPEARAEVAGDNEAADFDKTFNEIDAATPKISVIYPPLVPSTYADVQLATRAQEATAWPAILDVDEATAAPPKKRSLAADGLMALAFALLGFAAASALVEIWILWRSRVRITPLPPPRWPDQLTEAWRSEV